MLLDCDHLGAVCCRHGQILHDIRWFDGQIIGTIRGMGVPPTERAEGAAPNFRSKDGGIVFKCDPHLNGMG